MIYSVGEVDEPARQHPEMQDMRMGVNQAGHHYAAFGIDPAGVGPRRFHHGVPVTHSQHAPAGQHQRLGLGCVRIERAYPPTCDDRVGHGFPPRLRAVSDGHTVPQNFSIWRKDSRPTPVR
ncbi:hypothetical protein [Streptomyces sp. NPDC053720]|uniref:hypothetical protein n=1 Tax=Streptomyces sp. NPDC053720 TaxID=3154855 RepID=UPI0034410903